MRFALALLFAICSGGALAQTPAAIPPLPPGHGQELVSTSCSMCHTLERVEKRHQSSAAWRHTVLDMNKKGAGLTPAQVKTVVAYLAQHFGPETTGHATQPGLHSPRATGPAAGH